MPLLLKFLAVLAGLYVLLVLAGFFGQRWLMYFPDSMRTPPAATGLRGVDEVVIATPDGAQVICWWARARPGQPTLLYFHGNAGSLAFRSERIRHYQARGRGVFMMSYRGYSGSTGSPSESANVADALLAYTFLVDAGVATRDIILYGESLGTGVAVQVAAQKPVAGVVLDAPYTSIADVGALAYPMLPVRLMTRDRYDSLAHIGKVTAPLLVVHGELDAIIPVAMGRRIHAMAGGPSEIVTLPRAGHADHHLHGSYDAIDAWIERLRAGT